MAVGIMGGLKADSVKKSRELALERGYSHKDWVGKLTEDLIAWRLKKKRVKFVDYSLTFVDA